MSNFEGCRIPRCRIPLGLRVATAALSLGATFTPSVVGETPRSAAIAVDLLAANALIMTGTNMHIVDPAWIHLAIQNFVQPAIGLNYTGIPVDTPEQFWPFTGPDDMLFDVSIADGTRALAGAIAAQQAQSDPADGPTVVFGYSQSSVIATAAKRNLADLTALQGITPAVAFVMLANLNRPNGGINARFTGAVLEELGWTFTASAPTDTPFQTVDVARQYDLFADFPTYPVNVIADANAIVALLYGAHDYSGVTLNPADAGYDPNTVIQHYGDTTYYFIPTAELPLLRPLRDLGFDAVTLDAIEPALRVLVEFGYDRSIPFGQPTPARLFPRSDLDQLGSDLGAAIEQGTAILKADREKPAASSSPARVARPARQTESAARVAQTQVKPIGRTVAPRSASEPPATPHRPDPTPASRSHR